MLQNNVEAMNLLVDGCVGIDVIIISTNHVQHQLYWQQKLEKLRGTFLKSNCIVLCVTEKWHGEGAGNGLGTLESYVAARQLAKEKHQVDILELQKNGSSVAIYHTAGLGKRLAPLTLAEKGNKSAIKLPGFINAQSKEPMTVLEAVLKQTAIFHESLKGRLAVFWGDQIFIPSTPCKYSPQHHIEIWGIQYPFPNKESWETLHLDNYGVIGKDKNGHAKQIDKIDFPTLQNLEEGSIIDKNHGLAVSLGSFSLSKDFLEALLNEFSTELFEKKIKLDSDPHFWMPLTLEEKIYNDLMQKRKTPAQQHSIRMQNFKEKFLKNSDSSSLFGMHDTGLDTLWWDFGTIQAYFRNHLKLLSNSVEAPMLRKFYNISDNLTENNSIILNSDIKSKKIKNSLLVNVKADNIEISDSILVDVTAPDIKASHSLLYNVNTNEVLHLIHNTVRTDVNQDKQEIPIQTSLQNNGKDDWSKILPPNKFSYAQLSKF